MRQLPPNAPTWTAVGLILLGLLVIFLAWNSAASIAIAAAQLPYLISGGCGGLAIVATGLVMLRTVEARKDQRRLERKLEDVLDALRETTVASLTAAAPAATAVPQAPLVPVPDVEVLAGAGSFHRDTCRLVAGRDDLHRMPLRLAEQRGLAPCRICHPAIQAVGAAL